MSHKTQYLHQKPESLQVHVWQCVGYLCHRQDAVSVIPTKPIENDETRHISLQFSQEATFCVGPGSSIHTRTIHMKTTQQRPPVVAGAYKTSLQASGSLKLSMGPPLSARLLI